jgi:hypothetical protein
MRLLKQIRCVGGQCMRSCCLPCLAWLGSFSVCLLLPLLSSAYSVALVKTKVAKQRQAMSEHTLEELTWARSFIKNKHKRE